MTFTGNAVYVQSHLEMSCAFCQHVFRCNFCSAGDAFLARYILVDCLCSWSSSRDGLYLYFETFYFI